MRRQAPARMWNHTTIFLSLQTLALKNLCRQLKFDHNYEIRSAPMPSLLEDSVKAKNHKHNTGSRSKVPRWNIRYSEDSLRSILMSLLQRVALLLLRFFCLFDRFPSDSLLVNTVRHLLMQPVQRCRLVFCAICFRYPTFRWRRTWEHPSTPSRKDWSTLRPETERTCKVTPPPPVPSIPYQHSSLVSWPLTISTKKRKLCFKNQSLPVHPLPFVPWPPS